MRHWLKQTLIAFDQLLNAMLCGGWADETMSSASWRMERDGHWWGWMRPVIDALALLFGDRDHCHQSYLSEMQRQQEAPEFRARSATDTP